MVKRRSMKFMFTCSFFVLLISLLFSCYLCLGSDTISTGKSLFPNQTIISEKGKFELGFFAPGDSSNYYVGIWYRNIADRTVVWVANRNSPISYHFYNNSRLEMSNGNLYLYANSERIRLAETSNAREAVILDTGNFVLRNASSTMWQSFDKPTDTWLPGGKIGFRLFSDMEAKLVSWRNPNDPTAGNYSLGMEPNGGSELFIKRNDSQKLWRSGVLQGGNFSFLPFNFSNSFNVTYVSRGDYVYLLYNVFDESVISRIVIEYSGVLRHLVWLENIQTWNLLWPQPSNACKSYARCGHNAICDISTSPLCRCLPGFVPRSVKDWELLDFSGGCEREYPMCSDQNDFSKLSSIRLPVNPESLGVSRSDICELACAANCSCNAYAYSSLGGCLLFMEDLLDLELLPYNFGADLLRNEKLILILEKSKSHS